MARRLTKAMREELDKYRDQPLGTDELAALTGIDAELVQRYLDNHEDVPTFIETPDETEDATVPEANAAMTRPGSVGPVAIPNAIRVAVKRVVPWHVRTRLLKVGDVFSRPEDVRLVMSELQPNEYTVVR